MHCDKEPQSVEVFLNPQSRVCKSFRFFEPSLRKQELHPLCARTVPWGVQRGHIRDMHDDAYLKDRWLTTRRVLNCVIANIHPTIFSKLCFKLSKFATNVR